MSSPHIEAERLGPSQGTLLLTLNRPLRANSYTTAMLTELAVALEDARADDSVRVVVLTGKGSVFCGGADLNEISARSEDASFSLLARAVFDRWAEAPWPTIAALNGPAAGGGLELALACDLRVCAPSTFLRLPELELGLLPAAGGIRRLAAAVGPFRTAELVLSGRALDATTALHWGLVSQIDEQPLVCSLGIAETLASRDKTCLAVAKLLIAGQRDGTRGRDAEVIAQALLYGRRARESLTGAT